MSQFSLLASINGARAFANVLKLHVATVHPEDGPSPFAVTDDASIAAMITQEEDDNFQYVQCRREGCEEIILLEELESHVEMHDTEEQKDLDDSDDEPGLLSKRSKFSEEPDDSKNNFSTKLSIALRNLGDGEDNTSTSESPSSDLQLSVKAKWKHILKMPDTSSKSEALSASPSQPNTERKRLGVSFSSFSSSNIS